MVAVSCTACCRLSAQQEHSTLDVDKLSVVFLLRCGDGFRACAFMTLCRTVVLWEDQEALIARSAWKRGSTHRRNPTSLQARQHHTHTLALYELVCIIITFADIVLIVNSLRRPARCCCTCVFAVIACMWMVCRRVASLHLVHCVEVRLDEMRFFVFLTVPSPSLHPTMTPGTPVRHVQVGGSAMRTTVSVVLVCSHCSDYCTSII